MANRTIKKHTNPPITQFATFVDTFELGSQVRSERFKWSLISLSSSTLSSSNSVLEQNLVGSSTPSWHRQFYFLCFFSFCFRLRFLFCISVLCLFGPLSCNSLGLIFSDSPNTSSSGQQPLESTSTEDRAKAQQSKPDSLLNGTDLKTDNSNNIDLQHIEISGDFARKTLAGHHMPIFTLFPLNTKLSTGATIELASVDKGGSVLIWDFRSSGATAYESIKVNQGFTAISFNSNKLLVAVAYPGEINIFSLRDKKLKYQLTRVKTRVGSLDFNKEGDSLIMGGADGVVYNWRFEFEKTATTPSELEKSFQRYLGHSSVVNHVRFHPFGRVFLSTDWFGVLSAWLTYQSDAYSGEYDKNAMQGQIFTIESERVNAARVDADIIDGFEVSENGEFIYLVSEKGKIQVWMVRGFKLAAEIDGHKGTVYGLAVNPRGDILVTVGRDGYMRVWQLIEQTTDVRGVRSYIIEKREEQEERNVRTLRFLDNNRLVAGDTSGKLFEIKLPNYNVQGNNTND